MLHMSANKVEIYFAKIGFMDSKWFNLNAQGYTPLAAIHFWAPLWVALSSACMKREMLFVTCL